MILQVTKNRSYRDFQRFSSGRRRLRLEHLESRRLLFASPVGALDELVTPNLSASISGTIDGYAVSIDRHDAPGELIATDTTTWLIIHGNISSPSTSYIDQLAGAVHAASGGDQVLTLNWSEIADLYIGTTENYIIPVSEWASSALSNYGFSGEHLNLMGHSFGAYVAAETSERTAGGVGTIVGLDPAADWPLGYNPNSTDQIDFAAHSRFSWTFTDAGGLYGSGVTPASADEAITVTNTGHSEVVSLFANMLIGIGNQDARDNFQLSRLTSHTPGPWLLNQYSSSGSQTTSGIYEAVITAEANAVVAQSIQYVPRISPPSVTVTTPNGGESWPIGSVQEIAWTATGDLTIASINIQYSTTGSGGPFKTISTGELNDGTYDWIVPDDASEDTYVQVIAFDTDAKSGTDISNSPFEIFAPDTTPPIVTVTSPNGGETLSIGEVSQITWSADDNVGVARIDLSYSVDGGVSYSVIASNEANDGTFDWTVPDTPTSDARIQVIAYDAAGNSTADVSDAGFSLVNTSVRVKDFALNDLFGAGSSVGTFERTFESDGLYQELTEESYAGSRTRLEHKWLFDVTGGETTSFQVKGYHTGGDADNFVISYSTDDSTYQTLVDLTTVDDTYVVDLPNALRGQVFVRVIDTNRGRRDNSSRDTVFIDQMYFESTSGPVTPLTDISVESVSVPAAARQGQLVDIDISLKNLGNQNVSNDIVVTVMSDNATAAADDDFVIGTQTLVGGLIAGGATALSFSWDTTLVALGDHTISAQHSFVDDVVSNDASSAVVTIQDTQPPVERILDDGDPGFESPGWALKSSAEAYANDYRSARSGDGSLIASWSFGVLEPATYDVYATWVTHPKKHATNAVYSLYNGTAEGVPALVAEVNQRVAPNDNGWQLLGTIATSELTVTLNNLANGIVIADAVRLVPSVGTAASASFQSASFQSAAPAVVSDSLPVSIQKDPECRVFESDENPQSLEIRQGKASGFAHQRNAVHTLDSQYSLDVSFVRSPIVLPHMKSLIEGLNCKVGIDEFFREVGTKGFH